MMLFAGTFFIACHKFEPAEPLEEDLLDGPWMDLHSLKALSFPEATLPLTTSYFIPAMV